MSYQLLLNALSWITICAVSQEIKLQLAVLLGFLRVNRNFPYFFVLNCSCFLLIASLVAQQPFRTLVNTTNPYTISLRHAWSILNSKTHATLRIYSLRQLITSVSQLFSDLLAIVCRWIWFYNFISQYYFSHT